MNEGLPFFLAASLLGLGLAAGGCTPDSSGSPQASDTTSASNASASRAARQEPNPSPSEPVDADNPRSVAEKLADATVETRVKQALVERRALRAFDFYPEAVRGRVVLRGDVDTREQYERAERVARSVEGVETLANQLTVDGKVLATESDASTAPSASARYHTVEPGDTLWEIAREHDVSIERIRALNAETSSLEPGQRLRVR